MNTDQLHARLTAKPFLPFVLHQTDGRETRITNPEACAYRGGRVFVYIHRDNAVEVIDLDRVSMIVLEAPKPRRGERRRTPR
jgi:hypothetical protein